MISAQTTTQKAELVLVPEQPFVLLVLLPQKIASSSERSLHHFKPLSFMSANLPDGAQCGQGTDFTIFEGPFQDILDWTFARKFSNIHFFLQILPTSFWRELARKNALNRKKIRLL